MSPPDFERIGAILAGHRGRRDPMVEALASATPEEARAVWVALGQYIDNNDPEECTDTDGKQGSDPKIWAAAQALQAKLDAAQESFADAPVAPAGGVDDDSDLIDEDPDDVLLGDDYVDCFCTFDESTKTKKPADPECYDCDGKGRVELDMVPCSCTIVVVDREPNPACPYCNGTAEDPELPDSRCACAYTEEYIGEPKPDCGQCDGKGRRMWGQ